MTNVITLNDYRAPVALPPELRALRSWLVWRLSARPGSDKPRKIPFYARSGGPREGPQGPHEPLVSFDRAVAAAIQGHYTGVGLAMLTENGVVALDFDNCVKDGVIDERVRTLCEGTYSEFSPSGNGVRAFFKGTLRDRKDTHGDPAVEFFCGSGYVTVTGKLTPDCEMWGWSETLAPLSDEVVGLYRERFGASEAADDDWFGALRPKIGLTLQRASAMVEALDPDCGYDEWLHAGMALHHEFDGSSEALGVWLLWSKKSEKYPGDRELAAKWSSFGQGDKRSPITAAWLLKHSKAAKLTARYEAVGVWKEKIAEVTDDYDLREKVCVGIRSDKTLDDFDRDTLARLVGEKFKRLGSPVGLAVVRKLLASGAAVPTVNAKRPLTEFGNCERMLDKHCESLMYVAELDAWYIWHGTHWRRTPSVAIEHFAKETIKNLPKEADDHSPAEFFEWCALSQRAYMVRNMVALAASDDRVLVPVGDVDRHPYLLAVQNGVIDLRDKKLSPPDPLFRITRVCACEYNASAKAPVFEATLREVFQEAPELSRFVQKLMGYVAIGSPSEDVVVIPYGSGANGKSTLFSAIKHVFGDYALSADASTFISDSANAASAGGPREDLLRLRGARLVLVNEPDEGGELREGVVKAMAGGDTITARGIYGKSTIELKPTWVVVMPTNHKPIVKGADHGIWRRLMLLPFMHQFSGKAIDPHREEKLRAEAEGILAWIVEGASLFLAEGLSQPAAVTAARDAYKAQMDLLSEWIEDCCEVGDDFSESSQVLWQSWEAYARERGMLTYIKSAVALGRRLDQKFASFRISEGKRIRMRRGIRLRDRVSDQFF